MLADGQRWRGRATKKRRMAFERLDKRFNRLKAPVKADQGFDPVLAEQWNDAAGARKFQLHLKQEKEELSEDERAEYEHLSACAKAWQRRHAPSHELANLDPSITDAGRARAWELRLRPCIWEAPPLSEKERRELTELDARLGAERAAIEAANRRAGAGGRSKRAATTDAREIASLRSQ
jgi:hypothetical protein